MKALGVEGGGMSLAQHRVVSTESRGGRLARLEEKLKKWVAECAEMKHQHPVAARHLGDSICDLQILIAHLKGEPTHLSEDATLSQADGNSGVSPDTP